MYYIILMTLMLGFASLGVDFARIELSKTELQTAADAAARAAVLKFADATGQTNGYSYLNTHNTAVTYGGLNKALESTVIIDPASDVVFGVYDTNTRIFTALANSNAAYAAANAVKVTARRAASRGTATPLFFGKFVGMNTCDSSSTTIAMPGSTVVNFIAGFPANSMTCNGIGYITNFNLRLTDDTSAADSRSPGWQTTTSFYPTKLDVRQFATTFTFCMQVSALTSGITFMIQNQGIDALGTTGMSLGYGGPNGPYNYPISNGMCIKFDPHDSQGEGTNSTGMYINGANPTIPALDCSGYIDFNNNHVFNVEMYYNGSDLYVNVCDTNNGNNYGHVYTNVNIPSIVGGNTAWVGFSGAGGSPGGNCDIQKWWYGAGGILTVK